jgi:hypothetical protein
MLELASITRLCRCDPPLLSGTMPDRRSCADAPASQMRKKVYQHQKSGGNTQQPRNKVLAHLAFSLIEQNRIG